MTNGEYDFISFAEGVERIKRTGIQLENINKVITSMDLVCAQVRSDLKVENTPKGISKWQLPVYWEGVGAQFFISVAEPNTTIEEHTHEEGDGMRIILSGSIEFGEQSLVVGDWMFIPQGVAYSIQVGEMGATMCYCYQCCCVAR